MCACAVLIKPFQGFHSLLFQGSPQLKFLPSLLCPVSSWTQIQEAAHVGRYTCLHWGNSRTSHTSFCQVLPENIYTPRIESILAQLCIIEILAQSQLSGWTLLLVNSSTYGCHHKPVRTLLTQTLHYHILMSGQFHLQMPSWNPFELYSLKLSIITFPWADSSSYRGGGGVCW